MKIEDVIREMRQYVEDDKYDPDVATWITFLEAAMREPVALIVKNRAGQIRLTDVDGNAFDLYDNLGTKLYALPPIDTRDQSCRESADTSTCPHIVTGTEGTSYCDLAESAVRERDEEIDRLRDALHYYANPEIYQPHPNGAAFDRRDLSYVARAALAEDK